MDRIVIRGARQHNLKGIDLDLPRGKLIVVTGVSGSGKSSLAIDTLYAEGQRKYVESMSAYARQFLEQMQKPEADRIEGLSPAIAIQQRALGATPRSTVATATELHDHLRVLYARIGARRCVACGRTVRRTTVQEMADEALRLPEGTQVRLLSRVVDGEKGTHAERLDRLAQEGFVRVVADGEAVELGAGSVKLDRRKPHTIDVVVDRLALRDGLRNRLTDSLELALRLGGGSVRVEAGEGAGELRFIEGLSCAACGRAHRDLDPSDFSFNSPRGACPDCHGLGRRLVFDPALVTDPKKSIAGGALKPLRQGGKSLVLYYRALLRGVAERHGVDLDVPFGSLSKEHRDIVLHGAGGEPVTVRFWRGRRPVTSHPAFEGVLPLLERRFLRTDSAWVRKKLGEYMTESGCSACGGRRLNPEALAVSVGGKSLSEFTAMTIEEALAFIGRLELEGRARAVGEGLLREIRERLRFMERVGLGYLTLDRESSTLSGGEAQRTRLATQIGAGLTGVLYILDEPSIGLHPRDGERLLETLRRLRDLGNTVIVIEHDEAIIRAADHLVDLGPGAGIHGGRVVAQGTPAEVAAVPESLTGRYLSGDRAIAVPSPRRAPAPGRELSVLGASLHNLKGIDVRIPLGLFTVVTGVSGAGKSSLVDDTLKPALAAAHGRKGAKVEGCRGVRGAELLDKVVVIDQSPIGRTPRSNPATYTGMYDAVRGLFARLPESRARGYAAGRFSFNMKGGRCEACRGDGMLRVEMHFLPDVYVPCEACGARRYNRETLEILYKGKSIAEVLAMTVEEAQLFFRSVPALKRRLDILVDVGLGYLKMGQPATTLSGGEAQRIKLSRELGVVATGRTLYILDEPTTGLHFADIEALLRVLQRLVDAGNTVLVVEHNMEVVKCADRVIDLGPEGGGRGGLLVAEGTPEEVAACPASHTGRYLKGYLQ